MDTHPSIGFDGYQPSPIAKEHFARIVGISSDKDYPGIVNPCGEIPLAIWGGFCLIGDVVPYHAQDQAEFVRASEMMARFLIRTNLMRSLYEWEVRRTNRIGVGLTGIHEYAWRNYGLTFHDLLDGDQTSRGAEFWNNLAEASNATVAAADAYSESLWMVKPETVTTMKPSGTVSKLFGLTEGAHLPSMTRYLRWVQYRADDSLVERFKENGYPIRGPLKTYQGTMIVGFPTQTELARIMPGELIVTASQATPQQQVKWVSLLEHYWLNGGSVHSKRGGQVSYTLKYDPRTVSMQQFVQFMRDDMRKVKAMSVMPLEDASFAAYEYLPEEPITEHEFKELEARIAECTAKNGESITEDVDMVHVDCATGACPISFDERIA